MDIARYFIERKTISWMLAIILLVGGITSFFQLGRLEDPEFTIKEALVVASYPGASPTQVEEELALPIEQALQQLPSVTRIESFNSAGLSQILVEIDERYRETELRQIWDELRRKINDLESRLPPGVASVEVYDDFGDVFGMLMSITGDGYEHSDLSNYVDFLNRELVLINGVGKVSVQGEQQQQVIVELSMTKLRNLGFSPDQIAHTLAVQNQVSHSGRVPVDEELIRIHPTGEFSVVADLADVIISQSGSHEIVRLNDVASVSKEIAEISNNLVRYNGKESILVGVSFAPDVNVVEVGERVANKIQQLQLDTPQGIDIDFIYQQHKEVERSVDSFIINLLAAVVIVFLVLLVFMGLRAGALIGSVLFLTVVGSFIFMRQLDIELQRVSLGALIIALGMLVDNAIVVVDGMLIGLKRGLSRTQAATQIVKQTQWPLLGATLIAIIAFAPIGLSSDSTGEFAGSLFWVLLISLLLSWVTAISVTPFLASLVFNERMISHDSDPDSDPYDGVLFTWFRKVLELSLRNRGATVIFLIALLLGSGLGFQHVKQAFFPPSTTPIFFLDVWHKEGTDIRVNSSKTKLLESMLLENPYVDQVTTTIGQGFPRFTLTYDAEKAYASYAQVMVKMTDGKFLEDQLPTIYEDIANTFPEMLVVAKRMEIGPTTSAKIEARFSGSDPVVLRELADRAMLIIERNPESRNVRQDWRQPGKVIRPQFDEQMGRRVGVSKQDLDAQLLTSFGGAVVGLYRERGDLLPVVMRAPIDERNSAESLHNVQVFSRTSGQYIPISQIVSDFKLEYEDPVIVRRDRKRTITVLADHNIFGTRTAAELFAEIKPKIDALDLPHGYELSWGGEYEASANAESAIAGSLPVGFLIMFIITVLLFSSVRSALAVWVSVPLAVIGVTVGLILTGQAFGFMALLGLLSLTGMMIKNGIVLVEQIKLENEHGKNPQQAILDATVSRIRPVLMAAVTTILGMVPLLFDDFFASMSVAIMFGLGFATLFTLIAVPVAYSLIYRICFVADAPSEEEKSTKEFQSKDTNGGVLC